MKPSGLLTCILCASALTGASGISVDNPYSGIIDRNVFGLKAPPAPADPEANKPPPPKIVPTGITTILGKPRALFKVQMPARPPEPAKEQSFILTEGEREGQIEVLQIDVKAGAIKFNDYGTVVTLTLEKDAPKPVGGPPVVPGAAAPNPIAGLPGAPGAIPGHTGNTPVTTMTPPNGGLKTIPTRTLRLPPNTGGAGVQPQGTETMPMEQQMIMMEVEREQHKNDRNYPPLPPTLLTPGGAAGVPGAPGAPGVPGGPPPAPQ